jgi:hypothetical protein
LISLLPCGHTIILTYIHFLQVAIGRINRIQVLICLLEFISTFHLVSFPSMIFWAMKVRSMHSYIWLHLQWPKLKVILFLQRSKVHHSWNIYKYLVNDTRSHEKIKHYMQFNTQSLKLNILFLSILKMLVWHLWSKKPISIFCKLCIFWQCQLYVHYDGRKWLSCLSSSPILSTLYCNQKVGQL